MEPLIVVAVEPKSDADRDRLAAALARMVAEDSSFTTSIDAESGLTVLHGRDEPYLDRKLGLLIEDQSIALNIGAPNVAYRETITRPAEIDYCHKKIHGARGEFAKVLLRFEPGPRGSGFVFTSAPPPGAVPAPYVEGVAAGLEANRKHGLLAGFPVIDMRATLIDGAFHNRDSSALAFDIAARFAFNALREKGAPVLLEPVMTIEVSAPPDRLGAILANLKAGRGDVEVKEGGIRGLVPLVHLLGYHSRLDRLTDGRGEWTMVFDHFAPVPEATPPDGVFPPAIGMRLRAAAVKD